MINGGMILLDAGGRLRNTLLLPANFNGGTPVNAGRLALSNGVPSAFLGGLGYDAGGSLTAFADGVPAAWVGGIPLDSAGRVCASFGANVSYWHAGLPFTSTGTLACATTES